MIVCSQGFFLRYQNRVVYIYHLSMTVSVLSQSWKPWAQLRLYYIYFTLHWSYANIIYKIYILYSISFVLYNFLFCIIFFFVLSTDISFYAWFFSIACVSAPTAFKKIIELKPDTVKVKCLEYDSRFNIYGEDFIFYDFNQPLKLDSDLKNSFDLVIADPPFLTDACLTNTAVTIKFLAKEKILLCTGTFIPHVIFVSVIAQSSWNI